VPRLKSGIFAGARAHLQSIVTPALQDLPPHGFSCRRVGWHHVIASYLTKDLIDEVEASRLLKVKDLLKGAEGPEQAKLYELVSGECDRLAKLLDGLNLLKGASDHEADFVHFAARDFATAKNMEGVSTFNKALEGVWDAVVAEQERGKKLKAKKEAQKAPPKRPGGGAGGGPGARPGGRPPGQQQPQAQHPPQGQLRNSGPVRPPSQYQQQQQQARPDKKPGAKNPCFICNATDHWYKFCPKRAQQ